MIDAPDFKSDGGKTNQRGRVDVIVGEILFSIIGMIASQLIFGIVGLLGITLGILTPLPAASQSQTGSAQIPPEIVWGTLTFSLIGTLNSCKRASETSSSNFS